MLLTPSLRLVQTARAALGLAVATASCVPEDPPEGPRRRPRGFRAEAIVASDSTRKPARSKQRANKTNKATGSSVAAPSGTSSSGPVPAARAERAPSDEPRITEPFSDDFERSELGPEYRTSSSAWRLSQGRLCGTRAHNQPVWLARRLPVNARIEFDASSGSSDGDIKVELWGDGRSGATGTAYTNATSYLAIFGGWKNTLHVFARLDEHGRGRKQLRLDAESDDPRLFPVEPERRYHFRIERRDGATIRWHVDDIEISSMTDPEPLSGPGHEHFAFNDWETPVCFDSLEIVPFD
jgi:hypothetical protein